jgi:nitrite reductase/ring-hydroxylating ferredoxin subunit
MNKKISVFSCLHNQAIKLIISDKRINSNKTRAVIIFLKTDNYLINLNYCSNFKKDKVSKRHSFTEEFSIICRNIYIKVE